jgi:hypothetical protein
MSNDPCELENDKCSPLHPFIFSLMRLAFARGTTYYLRQAQFSADDAKVRKFA